MPTTHFSLCVALLAGCSSQGDDVCQAAADVIHECTGSVPTTWGECTGATRESAELIAGLDCEGLAAAQLQGKADGTCLRFFFFSIGECDVPISKGMANLAILQEVRARFPPPGEYIATFSDEVYESHGIVFGCGVIITETAGLTNGQPTSADRYTVEVRSDHRVDEVSLGIFELGLSDDFVVTRYETLASGQLTVRSGSKDGISAVQLTPYPAAPSFQVVAEDSFHAQAGAGGRCFTGIQP